MKKADYWKDEWEKRAKAGGDLRRIGGWGDRTIQEMLFDINDVSRILELKPEDVLLDIGCAGGLFELAYANWLDRICGVDYSDAMVELAKENTRPYGNVTIKTGNIMSLDFPDGSFSKVLCNSVLQYLDGYQDIRQACTEIHRVLKPDGIGLISLIPDSSLKEAFISEIENLDIDEAKKQESRAKNARAFWIDKEKVVTIGREAGFRHVQTHEPAIEFHRKYYFDIIVKK